MSVHRFSPEAVETLSRKGARQHRLLFSVATLAGISVMALNSKAEERLAVLIAAGFVIGILAVSLRRPSSKFSEAVRSTVIEVDPDGLSCRTNTMEVNIPFSEVTELRYTKDGVIVRTKDVRRTVVLKQGLEDFDSLLQQVEAGVPPSIKRIPSATSINVLLVSAVLLNLLLLVAAFTVERAALAVPICVVEALFLAFCAIWVLRSGPQPAAIKTAMLMTILPILSLLLRAWQLATPAP